MGLFNGYGKPVDTSGGKFIKCNLWNGGILVKGYGWNSSNQNLPMQANPDKDVLWTKLDAGNEYLFTAPHNLMITDFLPTPEMLTEGNTLVDNIGADHILFRGLTQFFWSANPYAYTPDKDVYVISVFPVGTPMVVWHTDVTGDIDPQLASNGGFCGDLTEYIDRLEKIEVDDKFSRAVRKAQNINSIYDSTLTTRWIGDSIMNAGTNAGWDNCYRVLACRALGCQSTYHAVNGTCFTDGHGLTWSSGNKGYSGFVESDTTAASGSNGTLLADISNIYNLTDICVLGMGTNDFGNSAPLGTIDDTGTDTFYGAFKAMLTYLQSRNPNMPILVIMPFKRETWATANEQGLILTDYIQAMYNVCRLFKRVYTLDLWSAFYLNSDDATAKSKYFLDYVHPSANAHMCIAQEVIEKIKYICVMEGISK